MRSTLIMFFYVINCNMCHKHMERSYIAILIRIFFNALRTRVMRRCCQDLASWPVVRRCLREFFYLLRKLILKKSFLLT